MIHSDQDFKIKDDLKLLKSMMTDIKNQSPLYRPGSYWSSTSKNALNEIKRCGLSDFRGSSNNIGLSFSDNCFVDYRNSINFGIRKYLKYLIGLYPIKTIYNAQLAWTKSYANECISLNNEILNIKEKTRALIKKYKIPFSLLGGCKNKAEIDGKDYSIHYLSLLEQHDNIASKINFNNAKSVFEIGGGFGTNIHLTIENYSNIKKILYLDIPPNLYVGTQYLRAFYGSSVFDYSDLKDMDSLHFSNNDKLEIFCIAPWQIEKFSDEIDIFINAHSFVEMPENVIQNYVKNFNNFKNSNDAAIALTSYDCFDLDTTIDPMNLPHFFKGRNFIDFEEETLLNSKNKNLYFTSSGKLSFE